MHNRGHHQAAPDRSGHWNRGNGAQRTIVRVHHHTSTPGFRFHMGIGRTRISANRVRHGRQCRCEHLQASQDEYKAAKPRQTSECHHTRD